MPSEITLSQTVHTLNGVIYHLEAHIMLLSEAYQQIYRRPITLDTEKIIERIKKVIKRSYYTNGTSIFVTLQLTQDGEVTISKRQRSLYHGYALRSIFPKAAIVDFNIPHISLSTTLRQEVIEMANHTARNYHSCEVALRASADEVDMINGAQVFAVTTQGDIITSAKSHSVEHKITKEIIKKMDIALEERPLKIKEITKLEELFYVDHCGLTAIKSCSERAFMTIISNKIAAELSKITNNKG
ncbi:MAG: hypothetical protein SNG38_02465 [Rikenellaceae bacterium]